MVNKEILLAVFAVSIVTLPVWSETMEQSSSRHPAPVVAPIEHGGIRYEQDRVDPNLGDQNGGYLAAFDSETGERLWRVQIYEVPDPDDPGLSGTGRYFRSMQLVDNGSAIEIENEVGARYLVDLSNRRTNQLSGPESHAVAPAAPLPPKPTPR